MSPTITDVFDLPAKEDIGALRYVVRLTDEKDPKALADLVRDYVLTPTVRKELPVVMDRLRHAHERGEEEGRFVHGSFGSGKSHFMAYLGLLLENHDVGWAKPDPLIEELEKKHRDWIRGANVLVVRLHMLTMAHGGAGFDRAVYAAFNQALARHGKPAFEFLDVERVIAEARREAQSYGETFWKRLREAEVVDGPSAFDELATGGPEEREDLARAYLEWKGRDVESAGIDPNWADGLQRLAQHARAQGFGGVVFLIDELLLWLSEKNAPEFKQAINQLNVMVDHTDRRRDVPLFVFVARQRHIKEFFPDLVDEDQLYSHLDHHSKRFEVTELEDVELRHICKERVLKKKDPVALGTVLDGLAQRHEKILPDVLQKADVAYLRDVYPFHPALIEMLIDVSALMQRERTALRLLYELLVVHYPNLPLGDLLPVGSAFEAVFPESGVVAARRQEDLSAIHRLYYQRFQPAMQTMLKEGGDFDEARRRVLDQLVKTALLAEISPRLRGSAGLTVERLVRLNDADVEGHTERGKVSKAVQDLIALSQKVPSLQVVGSGGTSVVSVAVQRADISEYLGRARSKVGVHHVRLKTFFKLLASELKLSDRRWFQNGQRDGDYEVVWRGTTRRGSVGLVNIRELPNSGFRPDSGDSFRLLIDYPWDEPGFAVEHDRERTRTVRKRDGSMATLCWLPRHLTPHEMGLLTDLCAAEYLASQEGQAELLKNCAQGERDQLVDQALKRVDMLQGRIRDLLREVYKDDGEALSLLGEQTPTIPEPELHKNLARFAEGLLDRLHPTHPRFPSEPRPAELQVLADWLVTAAESPDATASFDDSNEKILRNLGGPLELVDLGQTRASLRRDTRYVRDVLDRATTESVIWDDIDRHLAEQHGLTVPVRNLFLVFLARAYSYRVLRSGTREVVDVVLDGRAKTGLTLARAPVLEPAKWSRLRELVPSLKLGDAAPLHRTLGEQDRYSEALKLAGANRRGLLSGLHKRIFGLAPEATRRLGELKEALRRLAPLEQAETDSCRRLNDLLELWPDEGSDPIRRVVADAQQMEDALSALDETSRGHLERAKQHPVLADAVQAHLSALTTLLEEPEQERKLTREAIQAWNGHAQELVGRLVEQPAVPQPPPPAPPVIEPPSPPPETHVWRRENVVLGDPAAVDGVVTEVRAELERLGTGVADIEVHVRKRD